MYYTLPVKERMQLMKHYKTAYPGMSYNEMVEHFNTVQEYGDGGKVQPYQAKDQKDFDYRQKMYNDSLIAYNKQNEYNAEYLSNFKNKTLTPKQAIDVDFINILKKSVTQPLPELKLTTGTTNKILSPEEIKIHNNKEYRPYDLYASRTLGEYYGNDSKKGKDATFNLPLKPGRYIPNNVANKKSLGDSVAESFGNLIGQNYEKDYIPKKHGNDITKNKDYEIIRGYSEYLNPESLTSNRNYKSYGFAHKNHIDPNIKPIGIHKYYQMIPGTGSPVESSFKYDDSNYINVDLPYYKKPVQQILPPKSNSVPKPKLVNTTPSKPSYKEYLKTVNQEPRLAIGREEQTVLPTDNPRYGMVMDYSGRWVPADTRQKQYGVSDAVMKFNNLPTRNK